MSHQIRVWIALFAMLLVLLITCAVQGVRAQQGETPIAVGDTVKGAIKDNAYEVHYTLTAKTGDTVTITMTHDGGDLDPYLLLQDSTGKVLAKDDDSAGEHNAQIIFTFEKAGDYTLIATRFGQLSGPTSGDYVLSVKEGSQSGTAEATAAATQAATSATPNLTPTVAGTSSATEAPTTAATVAATEVVTSTASEEGMFAATSIPTQIATSTPSSTPVSIATPAATEEVATIGPTEMPSVTPTKRPTRTPRPTVTATAVAMEDTPTDEPTVGEPTEVPSVTPTKRPTRTRTPRPTATDIPNEETPTDEPTVEEPTATVRPTRAPTKRPTRAVPTATPNVVISAGPITDGEPVAGDIDDTHIFYLYSYDGTANEDITLTMEAQGGLTPSVAVIPPNGTKALKVATAPEGESKITMTVTLPDDGRYIIVATRADSTQGTTSGSFTLTLSASSAASEIDPAGDPAVVIGRLRTAKLVPNGGKVLFTLPLNAFTRVSTPGLHYLLVSNTATAQNFVLNFRVAWNTAGDQSGCGMGFWQKSNLEDSFVLLTNDNKVVLLQRQSQKFPINYVQTSSLFSPQDINVVTVIALNDQVTVYVNGKLQTTQKGQGLRGKFELETYNADGNTVVTNCRFPSGWAWSFDR